MAASSEASTMIRIESKKCSSRPIEWPTSSSVIPSQDQISADSVASSRPSAWAKILSARVTGRTFSLKRAKYPRRRSAR
jgi:hypothetical protein